MSGCHRSGSLRQSGGGGQLRATTLCLIFALPSCSFALDGAAIVFGTLPQCFEWSVRRRLVPTTGTGARAQKGTGLGQEAERNKSKVSHLTFVEAVGSLHSSASTLYILHRFVMSRIIRLFSTVVRLYNSQLYSGFYLFVGGKKSGSVGALSLLMSFLSPPSFSLATSPFSWLPERRKGKKELFTLLFFPLACETGWAGVWGGVL